ncbi:MAG TPA: ABC transporter permease [Terriglobales bacterium]|nr:ABC transporter permease [Terriglobales bacterium]
MWLKEIIVESWQSLARNRLRSTLTMLGITWGLVTVVLLLGYGQGVGESVLNAFLGIGNNVILSWAGQTSMQAGGERAGKRIHYKYEDIQAIRDEVPILKGVSAEDDNNLPFKYGNKVITISSKAVQFPYGQIRKLNVEEGRYFEEGDFIEHRRVCIFGPLAAKRIFGGLNPVGQYVTVRGQDFQIIGLLQMKIQDSSNNGPDNQNVFLPFETYRDVMDIRDPGMIVYAPINPALHVKAREAVRAVLARRHHFDPKDEKATADWDTVEDAEELAQFSIALQIVLGLIGALTLGVGGVGVMNIMLVSVTERTREIGLRKAVGARKSDILGQFLVEALVITFIGGALGMLLATTIAHSVPPMPLYAEQFKMANHEGDIFLRTSPVVLTASFLILAAVGVASGFWPALKAARMEPVEALRYE